MLKNCPYQKVYIIIGLSIFPVNKTILREITAFIPVSEELSYVIIRLPINITCKWNHLQFASYSILR